MQAKSKIIFLLIVLYLSVLYSFTVKAQSRLVLNNNGYIVIDNAAKLVIDNGQMNAITLLGSGGNIISESEFDQVKWNIGGSGGNYSIPFANQVGVKIPVTLSVAVPGDYGFISFSTYKGNTWDNSTYLPSDVTHITNPSGTNNSENVIDRFWIIEPETVNQIPGMGSISLNYDDNEHLATGNSITEANLLGQRFNSDLNIWGDYTPTGTINTLTNTVSQILFNGNFYRSWTLVDSDSPMPVELASYSYECKNGETQLNWTTYSEINNDYFTIESSNDGIVFEPDLTVSGYGNSSIVRNYSATVESGKYYRLSQTDFNGMKEELGTLMANCKDESELTYWQSMDKLTEIKLGGLTEGITSFALYDIGGKLVVQNSINTSGLTETIYLPELANGIYTISIQNGNRELAGKIMIAK